MVTADLRRHCAYARCSLLLHRPFRYLPSGESMPVPTTLPSGTVAGGHPLGRAMLLSGFHAVVCPLTPCVAHATYSTDVLYAQPNTALKSASQRAMNAERGNDA